MLWTRIKNANWLNTSEAAWLPSKRKKAERPTIEEMEGSVRLTLGSERVRKPSPCRWWWPWFYKTRFFLSGTPRATKSLNSLTRKDTGGAFLRIYRVQSLSCTVMPIPIMLGVLCEICIKWKHNGENLFVCLQLFCSLFITCSILFHICNSFNSFQFVLLSCRFLWQLFLFIIFPLQKWLNFYFTDGCLLRAASVLYSISKVIREI
jgi:hypothetical protein